MSKYRSKFSYFVELIIIIVGIMVSYLLNERRETNKIAEKKIHLISDINKDLYTDSLVLEQSLSFYKLVIKSHDSLLHDRSATFNKDSLNLYLDHFTSYYPFQENKTSYSRTLNDQNLSIEKEDTLLQTFINMHNYIYPNIHEWLGIEKEFILGTVLPYMDTNAPFIYPSPVQKSFDGEVFYTLRKKDAFMNYLKSGRLYKSSVLQVMEGTLNYLKVVKTKFNQAVKENAAEI